jgi:ABC-type branched-subunit amino acid transport system permease subunit
VSGLFLTCCVRGLEVTRHFTPELGQTISLMLAAAVAAGALVLIGVPLLRLRGSGL